MSLLEGWGDTPIDIFGITKKGLQAGKSSAEGDDWRPEAGYRPAKEASTYSIGGGGFAVDPGGEEYFNLPEMSRAYGFTPQTPTGAAFPTGSWKAFAKTLWDQYGMTPRDFMESDPEGRYGAYAEKRGIATSVEDVPVGPSGMPSRPPKSPEEAELFQWLAGEQAREKNEEMLQNALATLRYAHGRLRRGGRGSLAELESPMLRQIADIYRSTEYEEPDYSYKLLPGAGGRPSTEMGEFRTVIPGVGDEVFGGPATERQLRDRMAELSLFS